MSYCCVRSCDNNSHNSPTLSFFRVPTDPARKALWAKSLGRPDFLQKERVHDRICATHFEQCMFGGLGKSRLKRNAVPTLLTDAELEGTSPLLEYCYEDTKTNKRNLLSSEYIRNQKQLRAKKLYVIRRSVLKHNLAHPIQPAIDTNTNLSFPKKDQSLLKKWVQAVGQNFDEFSYKNKVVCSKHFKSSDFVAREPCVRLSNEAVPSLNLTESENKGSEHTSHLTEAENILKVYQSLNTKVEDESSPKNEMEERIEYDVVDDELHSENEDECLTEQEDLSKRDEKDVNNTTPQIMKKENVSLYSSDSDVSFTETDDSDIETFKLLDEYGADDIDPGIIERRAKKINKYNKELHTRSRMINRLKEKITYCEDQLKILQNN